jgi:hypothetical protein
LRQKLKHDDALSAAERKKVASRRGRFVFPHAETRLRRCPCTIRRMQPAVDVVIPSGLDQVRNSIVAHADAVVAIGGGAGKMSEVCLAWIYKRLIVALRVPGWSGEIADERVDDRVRYPNEPDDRVLDAGPQPRPCLRCSIVSSGLPDSTERLVAKVPSDLAPGCSRPCRR